MRSAAKRRPEAFSSNEPAAMRSAAERKPERKLFHAIMQVTRTEQWFVEAETEDEARALLESGSGQRAQIGECTHFEISELID
jgi:hypothetical protein